MKRSSTICFHVAFSLFWCFFLSKQHFFAFPQDEKRVGPPPGGGRRLALVIGNESYKWKPLVHPESDSKAVAQTLLKLGFRQTDVHLALNTKQAELRRIIRNFLDDVKAGDLAFVYYSGYAIDVRGSNYLLPVDLPIDATEDYVEDEAVSAERMLQELEEHGAKVRVLILDACQKNPFGTAKSLDGGLGVMEGSGSLIVFSAEAGKTADDSPGSPHSIFTQHLLEGLIRPGVPLDDVMKQVAKDVARATEEKQIPTIYGLLLEDVILLKGDRPPLASIDTADVRPDVKAWQTARDRGDANSLEQFISQCPQSPYASVAKLKLAALKKPSVNDNSAPGTVAEKPQPLATKVNSKDGLTYVWIPPGAFSMGCSPVHEFCREDEKPVHQVTITQGFWLGQTPVTQASWKRVMGTEPSHFKGDSLPVESVNWDDARQYCKAIGGRLPSEAEWEYAARAGSIQPRYGDLELIAWYSENSAKQTHPVAAKQPNAWKLYDMLGNVLQWTADRYGESYYSQSESRDPRGPDWKQAADTVESQDRVLRGGDWDQKFMTASSRGHATHTFGDYVTGVRCVGQ